MLVHNLVNFTLLLAFFVVSMFSVGCASKPTKGAPTGKIYKIDFDSTSTANEGKSILIDIVSAYDKQVVDGLETLTASEWFQSKSDYMTRFEGMIFVFDHELLPGQQAQLEYTTRKKEKAIATFIFANYQTPGEHRARLDETKILIEMNENDFEVSEQ